MKLKDLKSSNLIIRGFTEKDITPEYIGWLNDPLVVRYSNQRFKQHTAQSCLDYLTQMRQEKNFFLKIHSLDQNLYIGTMTGYLAREHGTVDIGILLGNRSAWGKGYGAEAWKLVMDELLNLEYVRKVTGGTMRCNTAMVKIFKKTGMQLEATRPMQELLNGVPQDILCYGKFA